MVMRIVRARAKPGLWSEFEREFFEHPRRIQGIQELRSVWVLQDLDDREAGFVVAIWDSESSARSFEEKVERNELLSNPLPGDFEFHLGEIRSSWVAPDSPSSASLPPAIDSVPTT